MKKVIVAFNSLGLSESALQYAIFLARTCKAHLVGVFLREDTQLGYAIYEAIERQSEAGRRIFDEIGRSDKATMEKTIAAFEAGCRKAGINYSVRRNKKNALDELLHETAFADLLVIDASETFSYIGNKLPGWFMKNVLHDAQCPVITVPKKFNPVDKLVLLYDGGPASIRAIKLFDYILPELSDLEATLLSVKNEKDSLHLPDNKLMKEWMKRHYSRVNYRIVKGEEKEIGRIVSPEGAHALIVTGSYQRSSLSMWLRRSLADLLLRETRSPLFIAQI
jgi:hypothetical protein